VAGDSLGLSVVTRSTDFAEIQGWWKILDAFIHVFVCCSPVGRPIQYVVGIPLFSDIHPVMRRNTEIRKLGLVSSFDQEAKLFI
jgi:hypothetical protein